MGSFLLIEWPNSKFSLGYDSMLCIRPTGKFPLLICTYESTIQNAKRPKLCLEVVWEDLEISTKSNKCHWAQGRGPFWKNTQNTPTVCPKNNKIVFFIFYNNTSFFLCIHTYFWIHLFIIWDLGGRGLLLLWSPNF